ncbi:MAG: hypothetical protein JO127_05610 [Caulobacteraceae bacterium]|nr:hypothetical protein [Caulobacteraceae bacterium]
MAFLARLPGMEPATQRTEMALRMPLGAVSPLWFAFGAAATAGVAYWWLKQWTRVVNVEAFAGLVAPIPAPAPAPRLKLVPASAPPALPPTPVPAAPGAAPAQPAPAVVAEPPQPDDLTRMSGIGPKVSAALAARGITRFAQIAAWTADDLVAFDKALNLKGRPFRESWIAQAKRLGDS